MGNYTKMISEIIENPMFVLVFGSGGVLLGIGTLVGIVVSIKRKKERNEGESFNLNGDNGNLFTAGGEGNTRGYRLTIEDFPIKEKGEEYQGLEFESEDFYTTFLKTVEEKKRKGDCITYE